MKIPDAIDSFKESNKAFDGSIFELVQGGITTFPRRDKREVNLLRDGPGPYCRRVLLARVYSHVRALGFRAPVESRSRCGGS